MQNIEKVKKLIEIINDIHFKYSQDYFETGKVEKMNLSKTFVPKEHILRYRLNLHESINDYLMESNLSNIDFYYRVKTAESIDDKIKRYSENEDKYPVNNWMNDIFGARMVLEKDEIQEIMTCLDEWHRHGNAQHSSANIITYRIRPYNFLSSH
ncbi:hypothetical protein FACS189425_08140 [Clostridia bacterium]|nr:hypothetical protein FACS189425_08140 [Clostridia bacterium]